MQKTVLHATHVALGARMVPFAGWEMPVQYEGVVAEVEAVRNNCGIFDASHMGEIEVRGPDACAWLDSLTTNSLAPVAEDQARYTLMLNESGGVIDDLIIYRLAADRFLVVCNASNHDPVLANLRERKGTAAVEITDRSDEIALIAVQGPRARAVAGSVLGLDPESMPRRFRWQPLPPSIATGLPFLLARTGYTGEDGVELFVPAQQAARLWQELLDAGAVPCGLGARDVCRIEAGLPLYGHEMDLDHGPVGAGLMFAVDMNKPDFVGKEALARQAGETTIGLRLVKRGVPRENYPVFVGDEEAGVVTSGTFSPTLEAGIAMARVKDRFAKAEAYFVEIRGRRFAAVREKLPFVHKFRK